VYSIVLLSSKHSDSILGKEAFSPRGIKDGQ